MKINTDATAARTRGTGPELPLDAIWLDAEGVGVMLTYPAREVREKIACRPDFPKPSRIGGSSRPRWNAAEVNAWMQSQRALTA